MRQLETADLLIVGTPVYKGSYTGLLKHLIDLLDYRALAGVPVGLIATGGSDRHALVVEHYLRPLFGFFTARTLPTGVFIGDRMIGEEGAIIEASTRARFDRLITEAVEAISGVRQMQLAVVKARGKPAAIVTAAPNAAAKTRVLIGEITFGRPQVVRAERRRDAHRCNPDGTGARSHLHAALSCPPDV